MNDSSAQSPPEAPASEVATPAAAPLSARAKRKAQRRRRIERRRACFELLSSGYSYPQIAKALKTGVRSIRRDIDRALAEHRVEAPERYIHLQIDRLTRALRSADDRVECGDMKAVTPLIKLVGALDRYHGLDARYRREARSAPPDVSAAPLAIAAPADNLAKVSNPYAQGFEKTPS